MCRTSQPSPGETAAGPDYGAFTSILRDANCGSAAPVSPTRKTVFVCRLHRHQVRRRPVRRLRAQKQTSQPLTHMKGRLKTAERLRWRPSPSKYPWRFLRRRQTSLLRSRQTSRLWRHARQHCASRVWIWPCRRILSCQSPCGNTILVSDLDLLNPRARRGKPAQPCWPCAHAS